APADRSLPLHRRAVLQVTGFGVNRHPLRDQSQGVGGSSASFGEGELALAERNQMDVAALFAA
ncbi:hypothetical protein, partial [Pseudomonas aeruginosa]